MARYDLVVLGSGPAGQKAAIAAARLGRAAAIVARSPDAGGRIPAGAVPGKTLREVVPVSRGAGSAGSGAPPTG